MSLAKKCDVCGKLYEDYVIINEISEYKEVNAFALVCTDEDDRWSNSDDATDCCPSCMRSILRHIKSLQPTVNSNNSEAEKTCATCRNFQPTDFSHCTKCENLDLWEPKEKEEECTK